MSIKYIYIHVQTYIKARAGSNLIHVLQFSTIYRKMKKSMMEKRGEMFKPTTRGGNANLLNFFLSFLSSRAIYAAYAALRDRIYASVAFLLTRI